MSNMTAEHGTKIELFHIYDLALKRTRMQIHKSISEKQHGQQANLYLYYIYLPVSIRLEANK